jgi:polyhydroxyalkanoate synthesis regulator phasin
MNPMFKPIPRQIVLNKSSGPRKPPKTVEEITAKLNDMLAQPRPAEVPSQIEQLAADVEQLKKQVAELRATVAPGSSG